MRSRLGTVVTTILVGLLALECLYVAVLLMAPAPDDRMRSSEPAGVHGTQSTRIIASAVHAPSISAPPPATGVSRGADVAPGRTSTAPEPHRRIASVDADAFAYSGRWEHVRGVFDGRPEGKSSRSFHPGSEATLTFAGRFVRLYGVVGPGGGLGVVRVDGAGQRGTADFGGPSKRSRALVYASPMLADGNHRLTIAVPVTKTRGRYVNIAGAAYGG